MITMASVKTEYIPTASSSPPSLPPPTLRKHESLQNNNTPTPPELINSVNQLRSLSTALSAFHRCYDDLQSHLDFIQSSIDAILPADHALISLPETSSPRVDAAVTVTADEIPLPEQTDAPEENPTGTGPKSQQSSNLTELEKLCETMCARSLRRLLTSNISEADTLREVLPKALKLAKDPAKLVFECIGRFFLQGRKAFGKDSKMVPGRLASVLALECFLLMDSDGVEISSEVKKEAEKAAVGWRKRIITEGGCANADEIDARGLLFLIAGYGIPGLFKNEDIRFLIGASNVKGVSSVLRRSVFLVPRIPDVIEWMVKQRMEIEAVDMAYNFGLEDKCNPKAILTQFLNKRIKSKASASVSEAKKQLTDLKSVKDCLEAHKVDPLKLLPDWNINGKIAGFEKEITELNKKAGENMVQKRKVGEKESSNKLKQKETKRPRFTGLEHGDASSYNGLPQTSSYLAGSLPEDHISIYPAPSYALRGTHLSERAIAGVPTSSYADVSGAGAPASSYADLSGGRVPTSAYAGAYGGTVDAMGRIVNQSNGQPYGLHGDPAMTERLSSQLYSGQTYAPQQRASGLIGLGYRPSASSFEGFAGLPNVGASSARGVASDLYQFADSVLETESYRASSSHAVGGATKPLLPSHHSSFLY